MSEKIVLTDVQFKALLAAQLKYNNITEELRMAKANLDLVSTLVLDAHNIPLNVGIHLDTLTKELTYTPNE